jgi:hypothetical protein
VYMYGSFTFNETVETKFGKGVDFLLEMLRDCQLRLEIDGDL